MYPRKVLSLKIKTGNTVAELNTVEQKTWLTVAAYEPHCQHLKENWILFPINSVNFSVLINHSAEIM